MTILIVAGTAANAAGRRFTLVIDAGHGGHDSGAKGAISYEKNINLKVALAFGKYVERQCPDVKVVYTRKTDVFVPLYERAEIANRNKADLFVSVHTNALPKGRISRGFETYTLGDGRSHGTKTNLDVAKRENSVIFMEKDYKQHYVGYDPNSAESNIMFEFVQDHNMQQSVEFAKLLQNNVCSMAGRINKGVHQDNFAVLRLTSMPACLIELGFITTPDEEKALNDADMVDKIARGIYNAFADYKNRQAGGLTVPFKADADKLPAEEQAGESKADSDQTTSRQDSSRQAQAQDNNQSASQVASQSADNQSSRAGDSSQPVSRTASSRQGSRTDNRTNSGKKHTPANGNPATDNAHAGEDGIIYYDENAQSSAVSARSSKSALQSAPQEAQVPRTLPARKPRPVVVTPPTHMETEAEAAAVVQKYGPDVKASNAVSGTKPASTANAASGAKPVPSTDTSTATNSASDTKPLASENSGAECAPVFKVQIMVCHGKMKDGDSRLKGLKGCEYYQENGDWKCTYGATADYNEIVAVRRQVAQLFPECFVIAFRNGEKMNVNQAIREYKQNKNKQK